jgi:hypothetical protein
VTDPKTTFQFEADIKELMSKMDRIQREFDDTKKAGASAGAGIGTSFESLGGIIGGVTAALSSLYVVYQGLQKSVETAAEFQTLETRLVSLYGSIEKGKEAFEDFKKVAETTPYSLRQVVAAGATIESFGASAKKNLKPVADLAAFMGVDIEEAASAFGRAMAGGVGAADILRERGVLQLIKSFKGIDDLTKLTLPQFRKALQETIQDPAGKIAGSTDRLSKTFTGAVSNMYDVLDQVANLVGSKLLPGLTKMAQFVGSFAGSLLPKETDQLRRQQIEFQALVNVLTDANTEESTRKIVIEKLNNEYRSYLPNLDLEKSSLDDITKALERANKEFEKKINLAAAEGILADIAKRRAAEEMNLANLRIAHQKTNIAAMAEMMRKQDVLVNQKDMEIAAQKAAANAIEESTGKIKNLNEEYKNTYQTLVLDKGILDEYTASLKKSADQTGDNEEKTRNFGKAIQEISPIAKKMYDEIIAKAEKLKDAQKKFNEEFQIIGEQQREFKDENDKSGKALIDNFENLQQQIESISAGFVQARMNGQSMGDAVEKALEQILAKAIALSVAFAVMQLIPGGSAFTGGLGGFLGKGFGFTSAASPAAKAASVGASLSKAAPVQVIVQGALPGQEFYERSTVSAAANFNSRKF